MRLWHSLKNHQYVERWLGRRLPRCKEVTLGRRQIFVFLTPEGGLYCLLMLITFIAGINYANNLILSVFFLLSSILLITIHHSYAQLSGLQVKLLAAEDSQAGAMARYQISVRPSSARLYCQLEFYWHQYRRIAFLQENRVLDFELFTPQRGRFVPPRLQLQSTYPLGLIRAWSYVYFDGEVWVSPVPLPCDYHTRPNAGDDGTARHSASGQDEFFELRPYRAGESLSRVAWAQLARGQGLLSKQFVEASAQSHCLDYDYMPGSNHETRLSHMAYWVQRLSGNHEAFSMRLPQGELASGVGETHRKQALRMLAQHP